MAQLGHTSIQITFDRYGHLYDEEATNIAGRMNAVYLKAQQLVDHGDGSQSSVPSAYGDSLRRLATADEDY